RPILSPLVLDRHDETVRCEDVNGGVVEVLSREVSVRRPDQHDRESRTLSPFRVVDISCESHAVPHRDEYAPIYVISIGSMGYTSGCRILSEHGCAQKKETQREPSACRQHTNTPSRWSHGLSSSKCAPRFALRRGVSAITPIPSTAHETSRIHSGGI